MTCRSFVGEIRQTFLYVLATLQWNIAKIYINQILFYKVIIADIRSGHQAIVIRQVKDTIVASCYNQLGRSNLLNT